MLNARALSFGFPTLVSMQNVHFIWTMKVRIRLSPKFCLTVLNSILDQYSFGLRIHFLDPGSGLCQHSSIHFVWNALERIHFLDSDYKISIQNVSCIWIRKWILAVRIRLSPELDLTVWNRFWIRFQHHCPYGIYLKI